MMFVLGLILGAVLASVVFGVALRYEQKLGRGLATLMSSPVVAHPDSRAYIIGLSEEEQSFKDSLNIDQKDTKLT